MEKLLESILDECREINRNVETLCRALRSQPPVDPYVQVLANALLHEQDTNLIPAPDAPVVWWRDDRGRYLTKDDAGFERMLTSAEIEQVTFSPRRDAARRARANG